MLQYPLCAHCGVEFDATAEPLSACPICADDRVAAPPVQTWTTMEALARTHHTVRDVLEAGLTSVTVDPQFAIAQRAILVERPDGCVLFDCVSLVDDAIASYIESRGGLRAIVPSHPHFYGAMVAWSEAFGGTPIYVHAFDRQWVQRHSPAIRFWSGDALDLGAGLTAIRCGGHFDGGTVLHVSDAAAGEGALLSGDVVMVTENGRGVSFMHSYPGYIPLRAEQIEHIAAVLRPYSFASIYGLWPDRRIERDGSQRVAQAAMRYLGVLAR